VRTFVLLYVALGIVIGAVLFGWAAVSAVRRHGFRSAVRAGVREALDDPPLVGTFAWLCVLATRFCSSSPSPPRASTWPARWPCS
jgi:hypothetical protein